MVQVVILGLAVRTVLRAPGRRWRHPATPDLRELALALRVGVPAGLHMFAEVSFFALASLLAGRLGAVPLAAHQVALQYASLTFTAAVGLGQRRVGAGGAGRRRAATARARGGPAWPRSWAGAAFMSASPLLLLLLPGAVARLMTDDAAVIATAIPLLRIAALFQISDGLQARRRGRPARRRRDALHLPRQHGGLLGRSGCR